jgi:hypothetical protein
MQTGQQNRFYNAGVCNFKPGALHPVLIIGACRIKKSENQEKEQ